MIKEKFSKFSKKINTIRKLIKFCILHSRLSLIGLSSKYFNVCSNTHCPWGVKRLKGHQSCRVRFKIREKATQVKSNLMNCLRHFWKENSTKWIFQTWIVTLMSLQKQHAKHFNHCSSSMLFHPILNIQIIMAQWISSTICLTSSGPQGLLIQSNYIFDWQLIISGIISGIIPYKEFPALSIAENRRKFRS